MEEKHHHNEHEHEHEHCNCGHHQMVYIVENLGCANCAAKMEKKISELQGVELATLTFATKQLNVIGEHSADLLPQIQKICASIESEVIVREKVDEPMHGTSKSGKEHKAKLLPFGIAVLVFIAAIVLQDIVPIASVVAFVISYVLLGGEILVHATRNLVKGRVFDENFLMSVATIGAFAIGEYAEAVGVMLFFRVGELFEEVAVEKSRNQIMQAVDMRPETVQLVHEHHCHEIPANKAKIGDVLLVRVGDRIPLDAIVVEGESRIDTAPVTGEPVPVRVVPGDSVVSGCINTSGVLKIQVQKTLEHSMVTRILHSVENAAASKPSKERFITRFARVYTPIVVFGALATAIVPSVITGEWSKWIYTAITFLVISCPCALVLSVPLAFFSGIGAASKKNILFKGGAVLEAMEKVKTVVLDKTGTVTKGTFEVLECVTCSEYTTNDVLRMAAECDIQSTHPIANSIVKKAKEELHVHQPEELEEIAGKGIRAVTGMGEILCGNEKLLEMYHVTVQPLEDISYGTRVFVACNQKMVGYLVLGDTLKPDSKDAVLDLKKRGIKTVMLTGDAQMSAEEVALAAGIEEVHAKLLPDEKLEHMKEVRRQYGEIMYVGDGINDAPVLAGADVGAAMGNGADAAIEAADVVFMTSSMQAICEALEIAKITNRIAVQNIVFALGIKALVVTMGFLGAANMWMAVFADTGVAMLCVLNAIRILRRKF